MSNARKIADLLDSNGDVNTANLDNVPASDNASSLSSGTIPAARIGSSSITNAKLAADAVDGTKIADNSIGLEHLVSGTDGNLITYDASGDPAYVTTGTSGQVLTSGGVGVAPTFQTAASGGGKVINVYSSYYTSNYYNSSIGSGTTSIPLSVTLTPDTVNSRFIIQWVVPHTSNVGYNYAELLLKRGGTTVGNPLQFFSHNEHAIAHPNLAVDSPSTTSSITYQLSATDSANNSNLWVNKGTQQNGSGSTMVVWELDS